MICHRKSGSQCRSSCSSIYRSPSMRPQNKKKSIPSWVNSLSIMSRKCLYLSPFRLPAAAIYRFWFPCCRRSVLWRMNRNFSGPISVLAPGPIGSISLMMAHIQPQIAATDLAGESWQVLWPSTGEEKCEWRSAVQGEREATRGPKGEGKSRCSCVFVAWLEFSWEESREERRERGREGWSNERMIEIYNGKNSYWNMIMSKNKGTKRCYFGLLSTCRESTSVCDLQFILRSTCHESTLVCNLHFILRVRVKLKVLWGEEGQL